MLGEGTFVVYQIGLTARLDVVIDAWSWYLLTTDMARSENQVGAWGATMISAINVSRSTSY